jgi:hypothetical protein
MPLDRRSFVTMHGGKSIWQLHLTMHSDWWTRMLILSKLLIHKVMLRPTVSRPVCLDVKPPVWGLRSDFCYCQAVAGLLMLDALSDERTVCRLQLQLAFVSAFILKSESCGTHDRILVSQIRDSSNLEGQGPRIYVHQWQVGPVIPQDIEFRFRRLLRLAGLRWRYSNPPPRGDLRLNFFKIICINSIRTSQETHYVSPTKTTS